MRSPPFVAFFGGWDEPWEYADDSATRRRLEAAGFVDVETSLEDEPTAFADRATFDAGLPSSRALTVITGPVDG